MGQSHLRGARAGLGRGLHLREDAAPGHLERAQLRDDGSRDRPPSLRRVARRGRGGGERARLRNHLAVSALRGDVRHHPRDPPRRVAGRGFRRGGNRAYVSCDRVLVLGNRELLRSLGWVQVGDRSALHPRRGQDARGSRGQGRDGLRLGRHGDRHHPAFLGDPAPRRREAGFPGDPRILHDPLLHLRARRHARVPAVSAMRPAGPHPPATSDLEGLDPEQRAGVEHDQGPLLIVPGAGTGKPPVIAPRFAHLIASGRARPSEILALTFNEKAATEMQERVDVLVPYGYADAHIATFHAFGEEVLSSFGIEIGIAPSFTVLDQTAQALFLAEHLEELGLDQYAPLSDPTKYLRELAGFFNKLKDYPIAAEDLRRFAEAGLARSQTDPAVRDGFARALELARAADRYNTLRWKQGFVDFADLLALTLRLFEESPSALQFFQQRFRYVLVDEFQDTNPVQFEIVRRLTAVHRNLVVVGDDDQSIYRFRGAHLQNILKFHEFFPDARSIVLTRNYRSTREILKSARRLILVNQDRLETRLLISKELLTERTGPMPRIKELPTEAEEAAWVAAEIRAAVESGARRCRDIAILVRSNKNAEPFLRALAEQGGPYYFPGSRGLFQRPEIRELVALLYSLSQDAREDHLYHLAESAYGVPGDDLSRLVHELSSDPTKLRTLMERASNRSTAVEISEEGRERIAPMLKDLPALKHTARDHRVGEVLRAYLERRGIIKRLRAPSSFEDEIKARNIVKFFKVVQMFASVAVVDRVPLFLRHLGAIMDYGEDPAVAEIGEESDVVQVLTIHRAKGLEFPVMYLVPAATDRFPTRNRHAGLEVPVELAPGETPSAELHKEEERRLCYVAFTRAKDELVTTYANDYGGEKAPPPRQLPPPPIHPRQTTHPPPQTTQAP